MGTADVRSGGADRWREPGRLSTAEIARPLGCGAFPLTAQSSASGLSCRSARSSASLTVQPAGARGRRTRCGPLVAPPRAPSPGATQVCDPHQLRHAHAVQMARGGVPLNVVQRQLGHGNLDVTSTYLQGIDNAESATRSIAARPPMMPASAGLRLLPAPLAGRQGGQDSATPRWPEFATAPSLALTHEPRAGSRSRSCRSSAAAIRSPA